MHNIYVKSVKKLNLSSEKRLELVKRLRGPPNAGNHLNETITEYHETDLSMLLTSIYNAQYFKREKCRLIRLVSQYVDESF